MASSLNSLELFYPESRFGSLSDLDGIIAFYGRVHALLDLDMTVLDVGCGRGAKLLEDLVTYQRFHSDWNR